MLKQIPPPTNWFRIPSKKFALLYLAYYSLILAFFLIVYLNCNEAASQSAHLYRISFEWEKSIPFIPVMVVPYFSEYFLPLLLFFVVTERELHQFAKAMTLAIFISGLIFYFFPAECTLVRPTEFSSFGSWFRLLHSLDKPHNLFPSLHITFSTLSVLMLWNPRVPGWFRTVLAFWLFLICLSVLTTHQHHLADILGGFVLSGICYRLFLKSPVGTAGTV